MSYQQGDIHGQPRAPRRATTRFALGLAIAVLPAAAGAVSAETPLPTAPDSARVDLVAPPFSDPTNVNNPLHPSAAVPRILMLGTVDGLPFRSEVTLLPTTKTIEWNGQQITTLESQYAAYLDGRIHEVALDWYAQADDRAVWYFGEDVFNYEDGVVADTNGTWLAGRDGPPGMIMPSDPQVGDVYRPENIPGVVFEEVTVQAIDQTVDGPSGPVAGAIVVQELHMDGSLESKTFAPGYGEFYTGGGGDLEAAALGLPTDTRSEPMPAELLALSEGASSVLGAVATGDWGGASTAVEAMDAAWGAAAVDPVPPMLDAQMTDALAALADAVASNDAGAAGQAAIDAARASLDLQLQYRPAAEIDLALLDLWAQQLLVDAAVRDPDPGAVLGDVTVLEWVRDRVIGSLDGATAGAVDAAIEELRILASEGDVTATADSATRFRQTLAGIVPAA